MINESYYVPIDINYKKGTTLTSSVPKSVLISSTAANADKTYNSLQEVESDYVSETAPERLAAKIYFANGGRQLIIFKQDEGVTDANAIVALANAHSDFIWVTFVEEKDTKAKIETISAALSALEQQYPKYLAITSDIANITTDLADDDISNVAVLYSNEDTITPYSAIVIPAYFSGINLDSANSLKSIVHTKVTEVEDSDISTLELNSLYNANYNVVVNVANRFKILDGGKMCDGQPIHSAWGFAVFKKDCENAVMDLIVSKLPFENSSNAVIENSLTQICNEYVENGLIGTQRLYGQETQSVVYNGIQYITIEKGQTLANGFYIYSIPISVTSTADKTAGRIPPIFIYAVINDVIRIVTITGEVSK